MANSKRSKSSNWFNPRGLFFQSIVIPLVTSLSTVLFTMWAPHLLDWVISKYENTMAWKNRTFDYYFYSPFAKGQVLYFEQKVPTKEGGKCAKYWDITHHRDEPIPLQIYIGGIPKDSSLTIMNEAPRAASDFLNYPGGNYDLKKNERLFFKIEAKKCDGMFANAIYNNVEYKFPPASY